MPLFSDYITKFGWPEIIITLAITLSITASHELKNVVRWFKDGDKKKENLHSEE